MRIHQYVYFALFSQQTTAAEMAAWLGIDSDEITVRGSRRSTPAVPVSHSWKVVCREPGLRPDEQISRVLDRLRPQWKVHQILADEPDEQRRREMIDAPPRNERTGRCEWKKGIRPGAKSGRRSSIRSRDREGQGHP